MDPRTEHRLLATRRHLLGSMAGGIGGLALADLLGGETRSKAATVSLADPMAARQPPLPAKAKRMIVIHLTGSPPHLDLYDHKPELVKHSGEECPASTIEGKTFAFTSGTPKLLGTPRSWVQCGESGMELSDAIPNLHRVADRLCLIRSMHTGHNGHEVSIRYINAGIPGITGRPSLGAWLTYGLGSENDELPAYMVLKDPGGKPVDGNHNWSNGWLPSLYQGTVLRAKEPRIFNLDAPGHLLGAPQENFLQFLSGLNADQTEALPGEDALESRIASFELAARMQTAAKEALDISGESEATKKLYGIDQNETKEYGTRCLIARRLVERGVRFVQLFLNGQPWDNHENIHASLPSICRRTDQPAAALVTDLKQRGLLDSTVVHWGGEIGRLPVVQSRSKPGRDHNGQGFTTWLAGGGFKPGTIYGETDEVGHRAAVDKVTANDYQATLLHQFGLDHTQLTYHHGGRPQKLTNDRPARVVKEIVG